MTKQPEISARPDREGDMAAVRKRRREPAALRREQLIHATIEAISRYGYAATTMAHITDIAGLSRGIVNFHFTSKEILFVETLRFMASEYQDHWQKALSLADPDPASQLRALIRADFEQEVSSRRKIATWMAFRAEAVNNASYRQLCWSRDDAFLNAIRRNCTLMKSEAGYAYAPQDVASAIYAMQEGIWLRLLFEEREMNHEIALRTALAFIAPVFPKHFLPDGRLLRLQGELR